MSTYLNLALVNSLGQKGPSGPVLSSEWDHVWTDIVRMQAADPPVSCGGHGLDTEWQEQDVFRFTLEKYVLMWIPQRLEKGIAKPFLALALTLVPLYLATIQSIPTKSLLLLLRLKPNNGGPSYPIDPAHPPALLGGLRPAEQDKGPCALWKENLMAPEMAAALPAYLGVYKSSRW